MGLVGIELKAVLQEPRTNLQRRIVSIHVNKQVRVADKIDGTRRTAGSRIQL